MKRKSLLALLLSFALVSLLVAGENVDLAVIHQIKNEAFDNSQVMDTMFYLTDVHGPRLTNSSGFHKAADWAVGRLKSYGVEEVAKEKWGPFGKTWDYSYFSMHLTKPTYAPIIGFPLAWTPGTSGVVKGTPMIAVIKDEKDFEKFKGKLKGKIILIDAPRETPMLTAVQGQRYSDDELRKIEEGEIPSGRRRNYDVEARRKAANAKARFLREEGVSVVLTPGYRGDGGTVFASSGGSYRAEDEVPPTTIAITPEHYNRIHRLLSEKQPVEVELEVKAWS